MRFAFRWKEVHCHPWAFWQIWLKALQESHVPAGARPVAPPGDIAFPRFGESLVKSEAMTEPEFLRLPGGSLRGWPLQILRVKTLKLQAAVWASDQPQILRRASQAGDFHSKRLFTGGATGKRIIALHTEDSMGIHAEDQWYHRENANANRLRPVPNIAYQC